VRERYSTTLFNENRFKLGLFAPNCSGGLTMLKTELWDASWPHNLEAARLSEELGLEFILPLGRWNGFRGSERETEDQGRSFETLTWAAAILGATREICIFGTLHVTFINPVFAAKMMVTVDHIGAGRFALNIVSGSQRESFEMFGVPYPGNEERYAYCDEWVTIVKRIWTETAPFDFTGTYFTLKGVHEKPKPYGGTQPLLVNAANSSAGRRFAATQTDTLFMMINTVDTLATEIETVRTVGGRHVDVLASGHLICRPTRKEAQEYYDYVVNELGDWEVVDRVAAERVRGRETPMAAMTRLKERLISGAGTYPVIGSYDDAVAEFGRMADAGLGGMAVAFIGDYLAEFPHVQEVLSRMEATGLRKPMRSSRGSTSSRKNGNSSL
jgi:FMNH2-dependent dimethyl sulfone monooxygenase